MARRVYEYVDQDGNTFYSFTRLRTVSIGVNLRLTSLVGTHFQNFLSYMRGLSMDDPDSPGDE